MLEIDPTDAIPIWRQIEEGVRRLIASGFLEPGAAVPSVRDLAKELRVNPATVAKAYRGLCDHGVLTVQRGEGTFVADHPPSLSAHERRQILEEGSLRYATVAKTIGASRREALDALERALKSLDRGDSRRRTTKGGRRS